MHQIASPIGREHNEAIERIAGVVHIVDDDRAFAQALAMLFQSDGISSRWYASAELFLSSYRPDRVECALVDLRMSGMHGLELQEALRRRYIGLPLIVVSAFGTTPNIVQAVRNGAIDFLEKPVDETILLTTVRTALAKDFESKQRDSNRSQRLALLTDREREVRDLLLDAKTTKQAAKLLIVSPKTVEKHRANIFLKLRVDSVPALIRLMFELER